MTNIKLMNSDDSTVMNSKTFSNIKWYIINRKDVANQFYCHSTSTILQLVMVDDLVFVLTFVFGW